jgi:hypothetical protein
MSSRTLGVHVPHVEDHCPNLPNVAFALRTDLRVQFVCQPIHSLQRQTCTYSNGTKAIYYLAFKLATETGREIKKRTWTQMNIPPSRTICDTKFCNVLTESQSST